jgi:fructose-bisphosphate aldolase class I
VPIVEPEVLFDGMHTIDKSEHVIAHTFDILFQTMRAFRVDLPGAILKTGMVLPGKESGIPIDHELVSEKTVRVLHAHVPKELGGVVFLSGGQPPDDAFNNLNLIAKRGPHPWGLTFSYSRALQDPVLKYWAAHQDDILGGKRVFREQLARATKSTKGELEFQSTADAFVSHGQDL